MATSLRGCWKSIVRRLVCHQSAATLTRVPFIQSKVSFSFAQMKVVMNFLAPTPFTESTIYFFWFLQAFSLVRLLVLFAVRTLNFCWFSISLCFSFIDSIPSHTQPFPFDEKKSLCHIDCLKNSEEESRINDNNQVSNYKNFLWISVCFMSIFDTKSAYIMFMKTQSNANTKLISTFGNRKTNNKKRYMEYRKP